MNELVAAAKHIQDFCLSRTWHFAFIGGLAVLRWGEPRLTRDVDLTIFTGFENEDVYVREILVHFKSRRRDMVEFARRYRVILVETQNHIPADIVLGGIPFEETMISNSSFFEFETNTAIKTCSAEDLIVMKAFADRDRDWVDVQGIVLRQQNQLDWPYIENQLTPLCELKNAPGILEKLKKIKTH
jgi:hypothetical protein